MSSVPAAAAAALANSSHTPRPSISRSAFSTPAPGTPSGAASRSFSRAPDAAVANANNAATTIPPLPSPATFDLLPQLHSLLERLLLPKPAAVQNSGAGGAAQQQQQGGTSAGTTTAAAAAVATVAAGGNVQGQPTTATGAAEVKDSETQPLEIHQLAAAASALKVRLQRARQACTRLGDVDRTVEEQEEEMAELEQRVAKMRTVLEDLGVGRGETGEGAVAAV